MQQVVNRRDVPVGYIHDERKMRCSGLDCSSFVHGQNVLRTREVALAFIMNQALIFYVYNWGTLLSQLSDVGIRNLTTLLQLQT